LPLSLLWVEAVTDLVRTALLDGDGGGEMQQWHSLLSVELATVFALCAATVASSIWTVRADAGLCSGAGNALNEVCCAAHTAVNLKMEVGHSYTGHTRRSSRNAAS